MMKFKIKNTKHIAKVLSVAIMIYVPIALASTVVRNFFPEYFMLIHNILWIIGFGIFLPGYFLMIKNYDVEYDGVNIRYKKGFGVKTIDLMKISRVTPGVESDHPLKATRVYIYLEFEGYDITKKPIRLYDYMRISEVNKLMNGYHNGNPLFLMYDDIIRRYPEKASMNQMPM